MKKALVSEEEIFGDNFKDLETKESKKKKGPYIPNNDDPENELTIQRTRKEKAMADMAELKVLEFEDERLINLLDGETEVIDTVYGPKIETLQQELVIELYLNYKLPENSRAEIDENLMSMELAKFEEPIRKALNNYDISNTDLMSLSITPSETEKLDTENGHVIRKSSFNVLVVFDWD